MNLLKTTTFDKMKEIFARDGGSLSVLLDPPDQTPEQAGKIAKVSEENGADFIAVGGSVGAQGVMLDNTVKEIKRNCKLPVILFPGGVGTISKYADAIYFMSLLNSRNPYWIAQAQISASPHIKSIGLETIPSTYLVVEPGGVVGWIGDANLLPRDKPYLTGYCALTGHYFGSQMIVMDGGSGTMIGPPLECIAAARKLVDIPISFGGGVKTPEEAYKTIMAGADDVRIGTVFENSGSVEEIAKKVAAYTKAIKKAGAEKLNKA